MSDLISRETLIQSIFNEIIKAEVNSPVYIALECVIQDINTQPIAYDVDKVVEQLEKEIICEDTFDGCYLKRLDAYETIKIIKEETQC